MDQKINILIFPAGSGIGLEICQSLRQIRNIRLVGCGSKGSDPDPSIIFLDKYYDNLPLLKDGEILIEKLKQIIETEKINYIFPGYDDAIVFLTKNREILEPAKIISSSEVTSDICRSKRRTYQVLQNYIRVPEMYNENNINYPVFVKPDQGQGSQGAKKIDDKSELKSHCESIVDPIILEYLPGREYTVDCFSDRGQGLLFAKARERLRIVNGISIATKAVDLRDIHEMAKVISEKLGMYGAWFFQVKYTTDNVLCLLEIAPRIAGCMGFYRGVGINFPLLSIYEAERKPIEIINNIIPQDLEMVKIYHNHYTKGINYKSVYIDLDDTLILNGAVNTRLMQFIYQCQNNNISCTLLTRNKDNINMILRKYKICSELFSEIIQVSADHKKSEYIINGNESLFIDDSFKERKYVAQTGAFVIDCSSLDLVITLKTNEISNTNTCIETRDVIKDPRMTGVKISHLDRELYHHLRLNVSNFLASSAIKYGNNPGILLDIAPQIHEGAKAHFKQTILTLDLCPDTNPTYVADITKNNEDTIEASMFDYVVCTEVLEHTNQPFKAVEEIHRILKSGGYLFLSVPCNFRIHGPLPDCWRFTEHGLKALLVDKFNIVEFKALELPERPLLPIHYTLVAQKI